MIERLLEKDQGKRFQSSSELLDAVEPLIAQRSPPSRTATLPLSWNPEVAFGLKVLKRLSCKVNFCCVTDSFRNGPARKYGCVRNSNAEGVN